MSAPKIASSRQETAAGAAANAAEYVGNLQRPDGHWCAYLTADSTLESDFVLLQLWLCPPREGVWEPESKPLVDKAALSIFARQLPDGGFNIYEGGPSELSASIKAYTALKLSGAPAEDSRMLRLRDRILQLGGIQGANSYVKLNLSLFGLYPAEYCPAIPVEAALLPFRFLYQVSSWTRAIAVTLAIIQASGGRRPAPAGFTLHELWTPDGAPDYQRDEQLISWRNAFIAADRALKIWSRLGPKAIRRKALDAAGRWMIDRLERSDGLGAIYPPMMYSIMALDCLGYPQDHPLRVEAVRQFNSLMVNDGDRFFFQPCFSPVWDTAIAAYATALAGDVKPLARAARWLLKNEIRRPGDWCVKRPGVEPSGWAFEYRNEFYPDIDDTAMVLLALSHAGHSEELDACRKRALNWLLAMQSRDGGWAAFDADNDWTCLSNVPFADHNAMLDPPCADITGRVLEALAANGVEQNHPAVRRGAEWLVRHQEADGSWYGRWGVAYIYGTCFALRGLAAAGESDREAHVLRAGEWLRSIQNSDGGWGESCASYDEGTFVPAESTPSQTAWAIMGLIAGGDCDSLSVRHGVDYLLRNQKPDGSWDERLFTGTGFPGVFYLKYHLYKDYFPLLALAAYSRAAGAEAEALG